MARINVQEETLINQIQSFKDELRKSVSEEFFRERDNKHSHDQVFYKGTWIPRDKIARITREIRRGGLVVFVELTMIFSILLFMYYVLWILFNRFILP